MGKGRESAFVIFNKLKSSPISSVVVYPGKVRLHLCVDYAEKKHMPISDLMCKNDISWNVAESFYGRYAFDCHDVSLIWLVDNLGGEFFDEKFFSQKVRGKFPDLTVGMVSVDEELEGFIKNFFFQPKDTRYKSSVEVKKDSSRFLNSPIKRMIWHKEKEYRKGNQLLKQYGYRFSELMQVALYGKGGYYSSGNVQFSEIGGKGDFITNSSMGRWFFPLMIASYAFKRWQETGCKKSFKLLSCSGGDGSLSYHVLDILFSLSNLADSHLQYKEWRDFYNAFEYHIVDISEALVDRQKQKNKSFIERRKCKVLCQSALSPLKETYNVIISNEFIDALPIEQFYLSGYDQPLLQIRIPFLKGGESSVKDAKLMADFRELFHVNFSDVAPGRVLDKQEFESLDVSRRKQVVWKILYVNLGRYPELIPLWDRAQVNPNSKTPVYINIGAEEFLSIQPKMLVDDGVALHFDYGNMASRYDVNVSICKNYEEENTRIQEVGNGGGSEDDIKGKLEPANLGNADITANISFLLMAENPNMACTHMGSQHSIFSIIDQQVYRAALYGICSSKMGRASNVIDSFLDEFKQEANVFYSMSKLFGFIEQKQQSGCSNEEAYSRPRSNTI